MQKNDQINPDEIDGMIMKQAGVFMHKKDTDKILDEAWNNKDSNVQGIKIDLVLNVNESSISAKIIIQNTNNFHCVICPSNKNMLGYLTFYNINTGKKEYPQSAMFLTTNSWDAGIHLGPMQLNELHYDVPNRVARVPYKFENEIQKDMQECISLGTGNYNVRFLIANTDYAAAYIKNFPLGKNEKSIVGCFHSSESLITID